MSGPINARNLRALALLPALEATRSSEAAERSLRTYGMLEDTTETISGRRRTLAGELVLLAVKYGREDAEAADVRVARVALIRMLSKLRALGRLDALLGDLETEDEATGRMLADEVRAARRASNKERER